MKWQSNVWIFDRWYITSGLLYPKRDPIEDIDHEQYWYVQKSWGHPRFRQLTCSCNVPLTSNKTANITLQRNWWHELESSTQEISQGSEERKAQDCENLHFSLTSPQWFAVARADCISAHYWSMNRPLVCCPEVPCKLESTHPSIQKHLTFLILMSDRR